MKTVLVNLRQAGNGSFQVVSFRNTVQLSVGQLVPIATVENWCAMPRVQVNIIGMVENEEETPLLTDAEPSRYVPNENPRGEFDPESANQSPVIGGTINPDNNNPF